MHVSRETRDRLETFVATLRTWQRKTNLVAPSTLDDAWQRHVIDGLQLLDHAPDGPLEWIDLGTGGGSPGLVVAIALRERPGSRVHCVESNGKKCAFLRHVAALTGAPILVHDQRIETFFAEDRTKDRGADIVSARALAPLGQLLAWSSPALRAGARGLFLKGARVEDEMDEARKTHDADMRLVPSVTAPDGRIVVVDAMR